MNAKPVILSGVLATMTLSGAAWAQPGGAGGPGGPRQMFEAADTDDSGTISKSEMTAQSTKRFQQMDADGDGYVTADEAKSAASAKMQTRAEKHANRMFEHLDVNKDGKISTAEHEAGAEKRFTMMDANGDGEIEQGEPRQAFQKMKGQGQR